MILTADSFGSSESDRQTYSSEFTWTTLLNFTTKHYSCQGSECDISNIWLNWTLLYSCKDDTSISQATWLCTYDPKTMHRIYPKPWYTEFQKNMRLVHGCRTLFNGLLHKSEAAKQLKQKWNHYPQNCLKCFKNCTISRNISFSTKIFHVIPSHQVVTSLIQLWFSNWQPFPHTHLPPIRIILLDNWHLSQTYAHHHTQLQKFEILIESAERTHLRSCLSTV